MNRRAFLASIPVAASAPAVALLSTDSSERGRMPLDNMPEVPITPGPTSLQIANATIAVWSVFDGQGRIIVDNVEGSEWWRKTRIPGGVVVPIETMFDYAYVALSAVTGEPSLYGAYGGGGVNELTYAVVKCGEDNGLWEVDSRGSACEA